MTGPTVIVDTNVFVSARNRHEPGFASCRRLLDRIDQDEYRAIVSTVTVAEIRAGMVPEEVSTVWRAMLTHLLTSANYRVAPMDAEIAEAAGGLRASSRLTLPDAVIVATGQLHGAAYLVTQDQELARRQAILKVKAPDQLS
ncbi:MAG: type II toxin-antitoxin system VapC family toxin [Thermoplasmata archaeon]|nr:PIN domain-containing protein [Thermoplasmata archaeon]